jgi:hypothetical protein
VLPDRNERRDLIEQPHAQPIATLRYLGNRSGSSCSGLISDTSVTLAALAGSSPIAGTVIVSVRQCTTLRMSLNPILASSQLSDFECQTTKRTLNG